MKPHEKAMELSMTFTDSTDVVKPNRRSTKNAIKHVNERLKINGTPSCIIMDEAYWMEVLEELKKMEH